MGGSRVQPGDRRDMARIGASVLKHCMGVKLPANLYLASPVEDLAERGHGCGQARRER